LRECRNPVFIPEEIEDFCVEGGFKVRYVKGIILICVDTKVFDFVEGDGLVFAWFGVWGDIFLWIRSEGSDIDLSRCNGPMWVNLASHNQDHVSKLKVVGDRYDDGNEGILKLLILELCSHINAR
jgi:hypothetical protein